MEPHSIIQSIAQQKALPLFYHPDYETCLHAIRTLESHGFHLVEFTNRGDKALENFTRLKQDLTGSSVILGIGTIKTATDATTFLDAGADFIVSPIVSPEVAHVCHDRKTLWIPGCLTPTEIHHAETLGARLVKIFPGSLVGPSYIEAIKDLFPHLKFMPTGGVDSQNIHAWFKAGVTAVGLGSKVISQAVLAEKNWPLLATHLLATQELLATIPSRHSA